jgi:hypothetical protein
MNPRIIPGLITSITLLLFFAGCAQKAPEEKCALSLCDCKCYPAGKSPDALEGKPCGMNCMGEKGIYGCAYTTDRCTEKYLTEDDSQKISHDYVVNASTYRFDGSDLNHTRSDTLKCPYCWLFTYQFKSGYPGYGDRSGQYLTRAETGHTIEVFVEKGTVSGAVIDGKWDELRQKTAQGGAVKCTDNSDCAISESKCADGTDPYHICGNGTCTTLTYVADPCLTDHVCPKGRWNKLSKKMCFLYQSCEDNGCNDNSETTLDECINNGTNGEGCLYTVTSNVSNNTIEDPAYCLTSSDCACGTDIATGECAVGNVNYIDVKKQCPDFCGGISGDLEVRCVDNKCSQLSKSTGCIADSDCVPAQCCHPTSCVNKNNKGPCNLLCTEVCEGPIDCGAGMCACVNGRCAVESA